MEDYRENNDRLIKQMFKESCDILIEEGHTRLEYEASERTIINTIKYLKEKRNEKTD